MDSDNEWDDEYVSLSARVAAIQDRENADIDQSSPSRSSSATSSTVVNSDCGIIDLLDDNYLPATASKIASAFHDDKISLSKDSKPTSEASVLYSDSEKELKMPNSRLKRRPQEQDTLDLAKKHKASEKEKKRQERRLEQQRQRDLKMIELERQRSLQKGHCLNYITIILDPGFELLSNLVEELQTQDVPLNLDSNYETLCPNAILWKRLEKNTGGVFQNESGVIIPRDKEVLEPHVMLWISIADFINMIVRYVSPSEGTSRRGETLREFIQRKSATFAFIPNVQVVLLVQGLEKYYKFVANMNARQFQGNVLDQMGFVQGNTKKRAPGCPKEFKCLEGYPSRRDINECLIDLQICESHVTVWPVNSIAHLAKVICAYTKAIGEDKLQKQKSENVQTSIFAEAGFSKGIKIELNGEGSLEAWKRMVMQVPNVSNDIASAVVHAYPSLRGLTEAYESLDKKKQESLLADLKVRRGCGILETTRRVGEVVSKRMCVLMTSVDGSEKLG